jgi:hypothetical protein
MPKAVGFLLILIGTAANNIVYLQDLWFGESCISLDSARAYAGILISIAVIVIGALLMWKGPVRLP